MTPDQINADHGKTLYTCRACGASAGLHWFRGTSCPVCDDPACTEELEEELRQACEYASALDEEYRARYGV